MKQTTEQKGDQKESVKAGMKENERDSPKGTKDRSFS